MTVPIPRFRNSGSTLNAISDVNSSSGAWSSPAARRLSEALAGETFGGIANEKFIGHTAHEAIATTGGIHS
jgi:hypothetical protein